jgi:hypothetical protein
LDSAPYKFSSLARHLPTAIRRGADRARYLWKSARSIEGRNFTLIALYVRVEPPANASSFCAKVAAI